MKEIKIKYEQNGNRIIAGCLEEQFYGSGETKDEAIKDMEAQIQFFKGTMLECEMEYPSWIDEPYKFVEEQ